MGVHLRLLQAAGGLFLLACGAVWLSRALRAGAVFEALGRRLRGGIAGVPAGALLGAVATLAAQSSSLAVIAVLAAADAGALPLPAAFAAVVGANVGSALVPQLLRLEPPWWAVGLAGAVALLLWRRAATGTAGQGMAGFVSVFAGLALMGAAAQGLLGPLALSPAGGTAGAYGAGAASTALLFSSTLTVGAMQRLLRAGVVPLRAGIAFMLGANVGTTADVLVAAVGCGRNGRATAAFHLGFNLAASLLALPAAGSAAAWLERRAFEPGAALAHAHLAFNVAAAAVALPALAACAHAVSPRCASIGVRR